MAKLVVHDDVATDGDERIQAVEIDLDLRALDSQTDAEPAGLDAEKVANRADREHEQYSRAS